MDKRETLVGKIHREFLSHSKIALTLRKDVKQFNQDRDGQGKPKRFYWSGASEEPGKLIFGYLGKSYDSESDWLYVYEVGDNEHPVAIDNNAILSYR